uniref:GPI-anchor transamidase n=1 Tax=Strongyloides papillosus TaxID=174720 RepID=A0A0N5CAK3_STREA
MLFDASILILIILCIFSSNVQCDESSIVLKVEKFFETPTHVNNWAVLVDTSRFWQNYRHASNVLLLYDRIKALGIPDSNIILMMADNIPCNARNPYAGKIFGETRSNKNLYTSNVEVDYKDYDVTVLNFIRLLTGRVHPSFPRSKRLLSNHQSNVLIYLTGHGGEDFLKFQDNEELTSKDMADAIEIMYHRQRYNELLFISDTCHAESMYTPITTPNVLATSSSLTHEESYSLQVDHNIGVYVNDRYAYYVSEFLKDKVNNLESNSTMKDFFDSCPITKCLSTVGVRTDLYEKNITRVRVTDFFGSKRIFTTFNEEMEIDDGWFK